MIKDVEDVAKILHNHGYSIVEPLGNGGFGSCFRVRSEKYEQTFVCKISTNQNAFNLELNILTKADHPNIVRCYEYFYDKLFYVLILEDCTEGNMYDYVKKNGHMDIQEFTECCIQVLKALSFLHQKGIAHLDIKPSNLMMTRYGKIKLGDFGLSRMFSGSELCKTFNGTKLFMSPEIVFAKPYDPFKADIWAFGVTAFYFLTGQYIASTKEEFEILIKTGCFNCPDIDNYPLFIRNMLINCLVHDAKIRPTSQQLLQIFQSSLNQMNEGIIKAMK